MFQVQRFTAESDSDEGGGETDKDTPKTTTSTAAGATQRDVLLQKLLERARSRAKRTHVEGAASTDGSNGSPGNPACVGGIRMENGVGVAHKSKATRASPTAVESTNRPNKKELRKERRARERMERQRGAEAAITIKPLTQANSRRGDTAEKQLDYNADATLSQGDTTGTNIAKEGMATRRKEPLEMADNTLQTDRAARAAASQDRTKVDKTDVQHEHGAGGGISSEIDPQRTKKNRQEAAEGLEAGRHQLATRQSDSLDKTHRVDDEAEKVDGSRQGSEKREISGHGEGGDEENEHLRPMEEVAVEWGLDPRLTQTLREEGVKHFFPIQVRVVPDIVATERHSHVQSRDMCVSAPTGSGKTLVFVLGVLQALVRRRVMRLRALVLLPSRDLAMQVHAVFQRYANGTGLKVGLAIGQTNFLEEQLSLVGAAALAGNPVATARASFLRGQGHHTGRDPGKEFGVDLEGGRVPAGGASEVDIVVATPGRLLDHLEQTPGFTLQHLRYLVIDEADRLLNQSYQGWVEKVMKAAYRREPGCAAPILKVTTKHTAENDRNHYRHLPTAVRLEPVTVRGRPLATGEHVRGATVATPPLRKLLFSATLTSNPQKLAGLDVVNPIVYTARERTKVNASEPDRSGKRSLGVPYDQDVAEDEEGGEDGVVRRPSQKTRRLDLDTVGAGAGGGTGGRFSTPATLEEMYTVCDSQAKPLVLLSLLREATGRKKQLAVVFTSSVDSTHRLFRLLQLFGGFERDIDSASVGGGDRMDDGDNDKDVAESDGGVAEFSSSLGQRHRNRIVRRARDGTIRVIVCSDGMARGMDLEGVGIVVNYDVPSQAKTYVHRVGRTARAGCRGTAVTIAKKGQVKQFLRMRAGVDAKRVRADELPADQSRLLPLVGRYQRCLEDLKEVLEAEKSGELDPASPVTAVD